MYRVKNRTTPIKLSPLRLHSALSVQVPNNDISFLKSRPYVRLSPLNLHAATSVRVPAGNSSNLFNKRLSVCLTPLKSPVLSKLRTPLFRTNVHLANLKRRVFPSIDKCNAKRCSCCNFISCKSTILSTVNHRRFNAILPSDIN